MSDGTANKAAIAPAHRTALTAANWAAISATYWAAEHFTHGSAVRPHRTTLEAALLETIAAANTTAD